MFFFKPLSKLVDSRAVSSILNNFHLVTLETAFVMRTFFFVVFGMTIVLSTIYDVDTAIVSGILLVALYAIRCRCCSFLCGAISFRSSLSRPAG